MKSAEMAIVPDLTGRPPHRGAWIEIRNIHNFNVMRDVAPRTGGRGLKSALVKFVKAYIRSPPAQGGVD